MSFIKLIFYTCILALLNTSLQLWVTCDSGARDDKTTLPLTKAVQLIRPEQAKRPHVTVTAKRHCKKKGNL